MVSEIVHDVPSKASSIDVLLKKLDVKMGELVSGKSASQTNSAEPDAAHASRYHLQAGGERIRGRIAIHASLALGLSEPDALCLAASAELLHNASLVHDDLQDKDATRRGVPAVWKKYGPNVAICAGDLMLSAAYAALCGISVVHFLPALVALVHERTSLAVHGQCADLTAQKNTLATVDWYTSIASAKSGALLSLPLELALIAAGKNNWTRQARTAAEAFATAYQIADDLSDVVMDRESGSMNIIFILESAGCGVDSTTIAQQLGTQHVDEAIRLSRSLPCDAGSVLAELSVALRRSLTKGMNS